MEITVCDWVFLAEFAFGCFSFLFMVIGLFFCFL